MPQNPKHHRRRELLKHQPCTSHKFPFFFFFKCVVKHSLLGLNKRSIHLISTKWICLCFNFFLFPFQILFCGWHTKEVPHTEQTEKKPYVSIMHVHIYIMFLECQWQLHQFFFLHSGPSWVSTTNLRNNFHIYVNWHDFWDVCYLNIYFHLGCCWIKSTKMTQMTDFTLFNDTWITYNRDVNKDLICGKVYIFFYRKMGQTEPQTRRGWWWWWWTGGDRRYPRQENEEKEGKVFWPKIFKEAKMEQDKDRDDGNNGGGRGSGQ